MNTVTLKDIKANKHKLSAKALLAIKKRDHNRPTIYAGIASPAQIVASADPKRSQLKSVAFTSEPGAPS